MDKKKNKLARETASVISNNNSPEKKRANLVARPIRVAFILHDNLQSENLLVVLTYISSIWGGYYCCLIPTDGNTISDVDWESIGVYEPDRVVLCANENEAEVFSLELLEKIKNKTLPFSLININNWNSQKDIFNLRMEKANDPLISSIPLTIPMVHRLNQLKQPIDDEKSNVRIPEINRNHPFLLFVAAQVGLVSDFNKKIYLDGFKAKSIEIVNNNVKDYLSLLAEFETRFTPLNMTCSYIDFKIMIRGAGERPEGLNIVFVGNNFVRDLCLFWNLRLAENYLKKSVLLFLPFDIFRGSKNLRDLCEAIKLSPWLHNKINLHSVSVGLHRLKHFEKRINEMLTSESKIQLVKGSIPIAYFKTNSVEETAEIPIDKNTFSFKCLKPEFSNLIKGGEWAVDIKFDPPYEYPTFAKSNHFLCGSPKEDLYGFYNGYWIRDAMEKFVHRASNKMDFLKGHLISDEQAFHEVFYEKGFFLRLTDKNSYAEGFLKLIQTPEILDDHRVIEFFRVMKKQDAYTFDSLCTELKKGDDGLTIIDDFVSKRILIRGMEFRCGSCGLLHFYPINILGEEMQCPGCLNLLQPPSLAPIKFRLNELAARAIEQGSIPVILTHIYLGNLQINKKLRLFGAEVSKDVQKIDVDYITTFEGRLVIVECKDFYQGVISKERKNALSQLRNLVRLAKQVDALAVILSTMMPFPSPDCNDIAFQIEKMKNKYKFPIQLISLRGKGIVDLKNPEKLVKQPYFLDL
ncbi:MAG: hypothetical protein A2X25_14495 [Chloroflexi bacterium GWB2_49_20]|nr:MAG: hypothetical protein A2X25_14495 [Chloroflexi bacterium GWB2_49_20]OGN77276.1 MAG: hypothetical protein A2X26_08750 [Chloroflexi bacterium GWC2_49_37]OGN84727.1 MAG: hypothetical protein A2X27_15355 [Chloroflexi bacterium GWD2_49_16]HBG75110.1 hypothetical protein [Anaerolineae bacterium]HCC78461.1 hypothetical protein [Anaerolineae bacterium]